MAPAGRYLMEHGVQPVDFNSYGSRRGNHEVMMRGTFANIRLRNKMAPGTEGGVTLHQPSGEQMSIYDAAMRYQADGVPAIIHRRQGIRLRLVARLGGQGPAPARRARRHRRELRAHPPHQPGLHGRAAAAVHAGRQRRIAGPDRLRDLQHRRARRRQRQAGDGHRLTAVSPCRWAATGYGSKTAACDPSSANTA
jgi:hypothetical protein